MERSGSRISHGTSLWSHRALSCSCSNVPCFVPARSRIFSLLSSSPRVPRSPPRAESRRCRVIYTYICYSCNNPGANNSSSQIPHPTRRAHPASQLMNHESHLSPPAIRYTRYKLYTCILQVTTNYYLHLTYTYTRYTIFLYLH